MQGRIMCLESQNSELRRENQMRKQSYCDLLTKFDLIKRQNDDLLTRIDQIVADLQDLKISTRFRIRD